MILDRFIEMMHQHLAVDGATVDGPSCGCYGNRSTHRIHGEFSWVHKGSVFVSCLVFIPIECIYILHTYIHLYMFMVCLPT